MNTKEKDFTPSGICIEGAYENDRNADSAELFKAIVREVYNVTDVIVAHHIVYVTVDRRDGFEYQVVEEIPSADSLIFNHDIAKKLWGARWREVLGKLALEPVSTRDKLLASLLARRQPSAASEFSMELPSDELLGE